MSNESRMLFSSIAEDHARADHEALASTANDVVEQLEAAKQRELELLAVIEKIRKMPAPVDPKVSLDRPIFEQWVKVNELCDSVLVGSSQALREHEANMLEELLDTFAFFQTEEGLWLANAIRHMAEERRKK